MILPVINSIGETAENGAFTIYSMSDWKETMTATTKGGIWSVTRQTLVNDELTAFTIVPAQMGSSAARKVGDDVYDKLLTVQTMAEDNAPLFNATHVNGDHNNVYAAGAPAVDTVDAIRVGMGTQTDPTGTTLGIRPRYLICPLSYEGTATTLRNSQFDPDTGNGDTNRVNWVAGTFEVVPEYRIDGDATNKTNWFMAAQPGRTISVYFLNGVQAPFFDRREGFSIDGLELKVRLDYGVGVLDWRGLALNGTAPV